MQVDQARGEMAMRYLLLALALSLAALPAVAQAPRPYHPPLTADGHPDIDGMWRNPPRGAQLEVGVLGDRLVVSDDEAKALPKTANAAMQSAARTKTQADLPVLETTKVRGEN